MDDAHHDSWQWMQRLTQALSLVAFAVIVLAGGPAAGEGADPARHRAALEAYQAGRWSDAWPVLGALADEGDVEAARLASLMARQGPRLYGRAFEASLEFYRHTLAWSLNNPKTVMVTLLVAIGLNVYLYTIVPSGFFPQTDEGRLNGSIRGDQTASFDSMKPKFMEFMSIIRKDPAVQTVAGYMQNNGGNLFVTLKPPA